MFLAGLALVLTPAARAEDEAGAAASVEGITPLMLAVDEGDAEKVEKLIADGAALDPCDAQGHNAIWHAVDARKADVLAILLKKAGTLESPGALGRGTMERAFQQDDWALIKPILDASPATDHVKTVIGNYWRDPKMEGSRQPLLANVIVSGDVPTIAFLLDCGIDPNTRLDSPVHPDFTERVRQKLVRYYLKNDRGVSMLMLASGLENLEVVKLLLERGAREAACTFRYKMAAMSFAADLNNHDIMRALIGRCPLPSELRVEISISSQRATLFKNEKPVESTTISTGVRGKETKKGDYIITNKEPLHISSIYKGAKMPFFMRLNCGDFGMHQGVVTGSPASHGCIRLPAAIARRWYSRVPAGTQVSIY